MFSSLWSLWLMGFWLLLCLCRCNHVLASAEESQVDSPSNLYEAPIIGNTAALLTIYDARCQERPLDIVGVCKLPSECRRAIESGICYSDGEQDYVCCIELKQKYVPKNQSEEDYWFPQGVKELNNAHDYAGCGIRPFADETLPAGYERDKHGWPWMVEICIRQEYGRRRHKCGGTLITKRHVLTAAHCFEDLDSKNPLSNYVLLIGANVTDHDYIAKFEDMEMEVGKEYDVQHISIHEDYQKAFHYKDIALLVLDKEVKLSNYAVPVCLPSGPSQFPNDDDITAMVVGWKRTPNTDDTPNMLQQVEIGIVPFSRCQKLFPEQNNTLPKGITRDMFCAGDVGGEQVACQNDTGGPLLISRRDGKWVLVGIVCFGLEGACAEDNKPSVYTRVISFVPWILEQIQDEMA